MVLTVGVIGYGPRGKRHFDKFRSLPSLYQVVAAYDKDPKINNEIPLKYRAVSENDVFRRKPDLLTVATSPEALTSLSLRGLEEGSDVLTEKPMATNVKEATLLVSAAKKTGRLNIGGYIERCNDAVTMLKEVLWKNQPSKKYGEPSIPPFIDDVFMTVGLRFGTIMPGPSIQKFGVLQDLGVHEIDILCYLFNTKPKVISAYIPNTNGINKFASVSLKCDHVFSSVSVNWEVKLSTRELILHGNNYYYVLGYSEQSLRRGKLKQATQAKHKEQLPSNIVERSWAEILKSRTPLEKRLYPTEGIEIEEPMITQAKLVANSIKEDKVSEQLADAEDGLNVLEVVDDAKRSYNLSQLVI